MKIDKRYVGYGIGILGLAVVLVALVALSRRSESVAPPVGYPGKQAPAPKGFLMVQSDAMIPVVETGHVGEQRTPDNDEKLNAPLEIAPYRTFIHIQSYQIDNNGEKNQGISNVRLAIQFPGEEIAGKEKKMEVDLPGNGEYWPIGNGQVQPIDRMFELPYKYVQARDGFNFEVQMVRKGAWIEPCKIEVNQLSQFNRSYICRTDLDWQRKRGVSEDRLDEESITVRIFTDREQTQKAEIPTNPIAIR